MSLPISYSSPSCFPFPFLRESMHGVSSAVVNVLEPSPEFPASWPEQLALLRNCSNWPRVIGYLALTFLLTPILLGFIFLMALFPLALAFMRLAMIYTPAYHLMGRLLGVGRLPERLAKPPAAFAAFSVIYISFWIVVAAVCIRLLFYSGFLDQNLIYIVGHTLLVKTLMQ